MTRRLMRVAAVAFGVFLAAATLQAQSLADVARAEAERRQQVDRASNVMTNDDLRPVPPRPVTECSVSEADDDFAEDDTVDDGDQSVEEAESAALEESQAQDEAYWRQRIASARDESARARTLAAALESRVSALNRDFTAIRPMGDVQAECWCRQGPFTPFRPFHQDNCIRRFQVIEPQVFEFFRVTQPIQIQVMDSHIRE